MTFGPYTYLWLAIAGAAIGGLSGMLGIGGGVLIVPLLTIGFGFALDRAVGTSLAMLLPPIGVFACAAYFRAGKIDVPAAVTLALAFTVGAWGGAKFVLASADASRWMRPLFGVFMLYVAGTMLFRGDRVVAAAGRTTLYAIGTAAAGAAAYLGLRLFARRLSRPAAAHSTGDARPTLAAHYQAQSAKPVEWYYEI
ncbi:MAG TPA: sulfite exporter TauE/SafE family protein [Tepidisphaeraceae bacterium]|nr:sulfite exporter TauE/SafE family protein [Tepidisphaeraceae bacterium]